MLVIEAMSQKDSCNIHQSLAYIVQHSQCRCCFAYIPFLTKANHSRNTKARLSTYDLSLPTMQLLPRPRTPPPRWSILHNPPPIPFNSPPPSSTPRPLLQKGDLACLIQFIPLALLSALYFAWLYSQIGLLGMLIQYCLGRVVIIAARWYYRMLRMIVRDIRGEKL